MKSTDDIKKQEKHKLDRIMKVLFKLSKKVMLDLINGLFNENFVTEEVKIEYTNSEFIKDNFERIIGDMFINIIQGIKTYYYHIEFQTANDNSMIIRMFQYGFEKACESVEIYEKGEVGRLDFPRQLVIFVEENKNITDELLLTIGLPDGNDIIYKVPVMKYWKYSVEELEEKKMYALLPLQVFKSRKKMDSICKSKKSDDEKRQLIQKEFRELAMTIQKIIDSLKGLDRKQEIIISDLEKILRVIENIAEYLYKKYGEYAKFSKEVHSMLKTLYDPAVEARGIKKGKVEGKVEGKIESIIELLEDLGSIPEGLREKINKQKI